MNRAAVEWTFFCITPLGLEELAAQELQVKLPQLGRETLTITVLKGGFEVTLPWEQGRALVHLLKIPTRVLVRLSEFKARDFAKAFNKLKTLPWTQWISHPEVAFEVSANECRLIQTTRMREVCEEALKAALKATPLSLRYQKEAIAPETVYLRGVQDEWTLSLDLCGDPLYKRGTSLIKDLAPMRENLAAAALFALSQKLTHPCHLWDPMCGSGTFVFEAENFFKSTQRSFSYQTSVLNLGVAPWKPKAAERGSLFLSARGSDIKNDLMQKLGAPFFTHDFFSGSPSLPAPCVVVTNPPYGERIKLPVSVEVFQKNLLTQLAEIKIERALIVRPLSWRPFNTQIYSTTPLFQVSNGGIEVEMTYLERRA